MKLAIVFIVLSAAAYSSQESDETLKLVHVVSTIFFLNAYLFTLLERDATGFDGI